MRKIIYNIVKDALGDEFIDKIFGAGALDADNLPPVPFAVIHFGVTTPGMGVVKRGSCTIWIHDDGADYTKIDDGLNAVYARLDGAAHVSEQDGSAELIQGEWTATSGDLFDPGFRTITKNSSYSLIGTGA